MSSSTSRNPSTSSFLSANETGASPVVASSSNTSWELHAEDFAKDLSCFLCLELFKEPVILPCGHNFCKLCLENIWAKKGVFCPECHSKVPGGKYIGNKTLEKLAEKIKAYSVGNIPQNCIEHSEPYTLYWKKSGKLACFSCREAQDPKDQSTQFLLIPDAVQIYTEKLIMLRIQLRSILVNLEVLKTSQEDQISSHKENKLQLQYHIALEFLKMHQLLHSKEKALIKQLKEEAEILLQEMEANLNKLQDQTRSAKDTLVFIQSRLYQENSAGFLKGIKSFVDRMEQRTEHASPNDLVAGSLCTGHFKGPIHYFVWKEMKSILNPDITCVTMDPKTAHPNLVLSEDLTSVRHDDIKQSLPDLPERFDCSVSVLGAHGYITGRHYWEVMVHRKTKWTLGVVKQSINRKGNYPLSPKDGHWLIKLRNKNELKAVDVPPKSLSLNKVLVRIGVFLDYEEGQVSFYDAHRMTHIYTFTDVFTERLYPYFCPCLNDSKANSAPLRVIGFKM
ncbi:E3 ubiquitin-protein ligase TRIM69 isoform X2 [Hemicordylus capensis]|nr:E3 ubiquitin-protein ligase TRIM69 isoform X2 [Hemicordylus capensis]XP_053128463.1 E3 ubiquitin-protein ligase TRIM69 isoform X2 [Hemicordylus capensis]XP_053128464.1 E3 ubiquitin-protein ligase TRIM69 isoform X2 [Hemicordylus capensis]XP_053128465.1 E3 ubiquitin-protein ligase TRIM69 isoform X2 [Hemicordylus capensis]XP_053128466.1 E3 ubiquitin-protein ligase TRIM69 isoform X2 [Hemicordylus capensis]XP_053128467.1 E3 ubiquitin-protein ligase TRIM69 isoform X2 [Hemicordylus capensis]